MAVWLDGIAAVWQRVLIGFAMAHVWRGKSACQVWGLVCSWSGVLDIQSMVWWNDRLSGSNLWNRRVTIAIQNRNCSFNYRFHNPASYTGLEQNKANCAFYRTAILIIYLYLPRYCIGQNYCYSRYLLDVHSFLFIYKAVASVRCVIRLESLYGRWTASISFLIISFIHQYSYLLNYFCFWDGIFLTSSFSAWFGC